MRVGLYQKFFTWAMLNLVLLGVITALFIGGVLLFNNNLYSPMLFNGSIASTFRMTSVELQYKPENQWASVLEECGRECGLHFDILILDDMDPPLAAGGLPPRVVEAARPIPCAPNPIRARSARSRPPWNLKRASSRNNTSFSCATAIPPNTGTPAPSLSPTTKALSDTYCSRRLRRPSPETGISSNCASPWPCSCPGSGCRSCGGGPSCAISPSPSSS